MQSQITAAASGTLTIGRNLEVHRMGYGAMRLTRPGVWGPPEDRENALAVLRRVVELDVNFIDAADAYGPNVNEEDIAEALAPYARGLVIATKWRQRSQRARASGAAIVVPNASSKCGGEP